jgi:hypothetical protein
MEATPLAKELHFKKCHEGAETWIQLAQNRVQREALVNTVNNCRVPCEAKMYRSSEKLSTFQERPYTKEIISLKYYFTRDLPRSVMGSSHL